MKYSGNYFIWLMQLLRKVEKGQQVIIQSRNEDDAKQIFKDLKKLSEKAKVDL